MDCGMCGWHGKLYISPDSTSHQPDRPKFQDRPQGGRALVRIGPAGRKIIASNLKATSSRAPKKRTAEAGSPFAQAQRVRFVHAHQHL
ncbi:hypothetical protein ZHAS_00005420 [Anopheles sinensis]|uniref:Uncharacterized protein n=1 Tax=Anopheles sinensis TaxID=74873 RepID=A0A084VJJ1_ANOSI|nr:hypothetical protein ZHAS_00005420 [Anopheles sinensis]